MSLPFLPGCSAYRDPSQTNFAKKHVFDYKNGWATSTDELQSKARKGPKKYNVPGTHIAAGTYQTDAQLSATALDRMVLRFDAFFKEGVSESRAENHRVRKCVVYFYLEDETIRVSEPKIENSGLPQGVLIKRHCIPKPDGTPYGVEDLYLGANLSVYGKTMRLVECDEFTRRFFEVNGFRLGEPEQVPGDQYLEHRAAFGTHMRTSTGPKPDNLAKFLMFDRKVLRFYCYWDDRDTMFGEKRPFLLHYFLADDTVEILETRQHNSGRDPFPALLKRQRLPKSFNSLSDLSPSADNCYTDIDFAVGQSVNVFGRSFVVYSCDEFTRFYYSQRYGLPLFPDLTEQVKDKPIPMPKMEVPPHNGFGTEEDSLGSFLYLVPKPPRRDLIKLVEKDRMVLRYAALLANAKAEDVDRRFVLSFYLADDTISVYEPPQQNSGFLGGKFLERGLQIKPGTRDHYVVDDFKIGAQITLQSWVFELLDCDQYTRDYLAGPGAQRSSDARSPETAAAAAMSGETQAIHEKIKSILASSSNRVSMRNTFAALDTQSCGLVSFDDFAAILHQNDINLTTDELTSLFIRWDLSGTGSVTYHPFCDAVGA